MQRLLQAHARVDHADKHANTALIWAAQNGHSAVVVDLLKYFESVNISTKTPSTGPESAVQKGSEGLAQKISIAGRAPQKRNNADG